MACYRPLHAWRGVANSNGKRPLVFTQPRYVDKDSIQVPCGCCVGCRLERSRQWAMRCMDEASLYDSNSFITLTFNDEHLPSNRSLDVATFQMFMKRLRKEVAPLRIRFFTAGSTDRDTGDLTITHLSLIMDSPIGFISLTRLLVRRFIGLLRWRSYGLLDIVQLAMLRSVARRMWRVTILRKLEGLYLITTTLIRVLVRCFIPNTLR